MMIKPQHWVQCTEADLYSIYIEKDKNLWTNIVVVMGVCLSLDFSLHTSFSTCSRLSTSRKTAVNILPYKCKNVLVEMYIICASTKDDETSLRHVWISFKVFLEVFL
jgi:hypothetical protein